MSVRAIIRPANPDKIEMTLTITMPLADWKDLRTQMSSAYPSWAFSSAISRLVNHAEEHFREDVEHTP